MARVPIRLAERKAARERYIALLEASDRKMAGPAMDLANSIREMNSVQLSVLGALFTVISDHPSSLSQEGILRDLQDAVNEIRREMH